MNIQKSFDISKYFNDEEMACPCCGDIKMDERFLEMLLKFRIAWAKPMHVNSAYRCLKHNAEVGGSPGSKHTIGEAIDISVVGSERFAFIKLAIKTGFGGIGIARTFVHLDSRKKPFALWTYS